jgi:hypothetical protein
MTDVNQLDQETRISKATNELILAIAKLETLSEKWEEGQVCFLDSA